MRSRLKTKYHKFSKNSIKIIKLNKTKKIHYDLKGSKMFIHNIIFCKYTKFSKRNCVFSSNV